MVSGGITKDTLSKSKNDPQFCVYSVINGYTVDLLE